MIPLHHDRQLSLRSAATGLAKQLGGFPTTQGAMCCCPVHDDRNPSLSVRIGRSTLLFKCFAGCDTRDVIRAIRQIDRTAIGTLVDGKCAPFDASREIRLRDRACETWDLAEACAGTLAESYLTARGLSLPVSGLRFNGRTPLKERVGMTYRAALIAAVHDRGRFVAVQRAFLDAGAGRLASDLGNPRRLLGRPLGGAVVLAPEDDVLGLAEGVETAMSASAILGIPVWATLGAGRLAYISIPDRVRHLIILPDNDRSGRIAAAKALQAYARQDRIVETIWPPAAHNDWNDALMAKLGPRS